MTDSETTQLMALPPVSDQRTLNEVYAILTVTSAQRRAIWWSGMLTGLCYGVIVTGFLQALTDWLK